MTLQEILTDSSAYLDQSTNLPTGDELNTRVNYANQVVKNWASAYKFKERKAKYVFTASTLATISMPTDFEDMNGNPQELVSGGAYQEHTEIDPKFSYNQVDSHFCYLLGDPKAGYSLVFNNLAVGATTSVDYFKKVSVMATLTDVCEVPDGTYVTDGLIAYVLESRGDDRFPTVSARVLSKLQAMIGDNQSGANSATRAPKVNYHLGRR